MMELQAGVALEPCSPQSENKSGKSPSSKYRRGIRFGDQLEQYEFLKERKIRKMALRMRDISPYIDSPISARRDGSRRRGSGRLCSSDPQSVSNGSLHWRSHSDAFAAQVVKSATSDAAAVRRQLEASRCALDELTQEDLLAVTKARNQRISPAWHRVLYAVRVALGDLQCSSPSDTVQEDSTWTACALLLSAPDTIERLKQIKPTAMGMEVFESFRFAIHRSPPLRGAPSTSSYQAISRSLIEPKAIRVLAGWVKSLDDATAMLHMLQQLQSKALSGKLSRAAATLPASLPGSKAAMMPRFGMEVSSHRCGSGRRDGASLRQPTKKLRWRKQVVHPSKLAQTSGIFSASDAETLVPPPTWPPSATLLPLRRFKANLRQKLIAEPHNFERVEQQAKAKGNRGSSSHGNHSNGSSGRHSPLHHSTIALSTDDLRTVLADAGLRPSRDVLCSFFHECRDAARSRGNGSGNGSGSNSPQNRSTIISDATNNLSGDVDGNDNTVKVIDSSNRSSSSSSMSSSVVSWDDVQRIVLKSRRPVTVPPHAPVRRRLLYRPSSNSNGINGDHRSSSNNGSRESAMMMNGNSQSQSNMNGSSSYQSMQRGGGANGLLPHMDKAPHCRNRNNASSPSSFVRRARGSRGSKGSSPSGRRPDRVFRRRGRRRPGGRHKMHDYDDAGEDRVAVAAENVGNGENGENGMEGTEGEVPGARHRHRHRHRHVAARTVQARVRGVQQRRRGHRERRRLSAAATTIQARARGLCGRRWQCEQRRRGDSATTIQQNERGRQGRRRAGARRLARIRGLVARDAAARLIQHSVRCHKRDKLALVVIELNNVRLAKAATKIQARARGLCGRRWQCEQRRRGDSATTIQQNERGRQGRRRAGAHRLAQARVRQVAAQEAVAMIQRMFRGVQRRQHQRILVSIRMARLLMEQTRRRAAITIQSLARGRRGRRLATSRKSREAEVRRQAAAVRIQAICRGRLSRRQTRVVAAAALAAAARVEQQKFKAARTLQAAVRGKLARSRFIVDMARRRQQERGRQEAAARVIQRQSRGREGRKKYQTVKNEHDVKAKRKLNLMQIAKLKQRVVRKKGAFAKFASLGASFKGLFGFGKRNQTRQ